MIIESCNTDINELDHYLQQTLLFLYREWYKKDIGIVACCLKDGDKVTATLTTNKNAHEMCRKLMEMFSIYDSRINKELLSIKKELTDDFFYPILPKRKMKKQRHIS